MKMLLTGSTGFLGRILIKNLSGFEIITLGRNDCDVIADLSMGPLKLPAVDSVVHAAGKAHLVPKTQQEQNDFFHVNVQGTLNLLNSLELNLPKYFVFISSVAVYGKTEGTLIKETEELNATDPYGRSKIEAERLVENWCTMNKVRMCILRLPLIAAPNPPGNLGFMIKGIEKGYYLDIAGGRSLKSIVLAKDIAMVIPRAMEVGGIYNLTDGQHPSVGELSFLIASQLNKNKPLSIPYWFARVLSKIGDILGRKAPLNSNKLRKLTADLTFDDSKARRVLNWSSTPVLTHFTLKG